VAGSSLCLRSISGAGAELSLTPSRYKDCGRDYVAHVTQHRSEKRQPRKVVTTDKSALLWMYCREIAPYETSTFSKNVGELIARATATQKRGARAQRIRTPRDPNKVSAKLASSLNKNSEAAN
jgi:hypothetical protein